MGEDWVEQTRKKSGQVPLRKFEHLLEPLTEVQSVEEEALEILRHTLEPWMLQVKLQEMIDYNSQHSDNKIYPSKTNSTRPTTVRNFFSKRF